MVSRVCPHRGPLQYISAWLVFATLGMTITAPSAAAQNSGEAHRTGNHGVQWINVDAGAFTMGRGGSAKQVTISRFMMSATEITFDQYDTFCDATGKEKPDDNNWGRGTRPVINVSYDDAVEFCHWLSRETNSLVRLPNEAEWEYAAQGGRHSKGYSYSGGNNKDEVSWNEDNSRNRTHPVGTKKPNELGLFDMSGNVWEWCSDWMEVNTKGPQSDQPSKGTRLKMPLRGDSFDNPGESMGFRESVNLARDSRHYNIGFRVVKSQ